MRQIITTIVATLSSSLLLVSSSWATEYTVDKSHSSVSFKIRHLFSNVQGAFNEFESSFVFEPNHPEKWRAKAVIQAASIDTQVEQRDNHLRSKDFFDAATYPTITFESTEVTDVTPTKASLHGLLSMHGVQKPIVLDIAIHGEGKDPWGNQRSGFTATTTLNRKDFGLNWNEVLETGQLLVGEEVLITIEIEGIAKE